MLNIAEGREQIVSCVRTSRPWTNLRLAPESPNGLGWQHDCSGFLIWPVQSQSRDRRQNTPVIKGKRSCNSQQGVDWAWVWPAWLYLNWKIKALKSVEISTSHGGDWDWWQAHWFSIFKTSLRNRRRKKSSNICHRLLFWYVMSSYNLNIFPHKQKSYGVWNLAWDKLRIALTIRFGIEMAEILSLCGFESFWWPGGFVVILITTHAY